MITARNSSNGSEGLKVLIFVEGAPLPFLGMESDCRTFQTPRRAVSVSEPLWPEEEIKLPVPVFHSQWEIYQAANLALAQHSQFERNGGIGVSVAAHRARYNPLDATYTIPIQFWGTQEHSQKGFKL